MRNMHRRPSARYTGDKRSLSSSSCRASLNVRGMRRGRRRRGVGKAHCDEAIIGRGEVENNMAIARGAHAEIASAFGIALAKLLLATACFNRRLNAVAPSCLIAAWRNNKPPYQRVNSTSVAMPSVVAPRDIARRKCTARRNAACARPASRRPTPSYQAWR